MGYRFWRQIVYWWQGNYIRREYVIVLYLAQNSICLSRSVLTIDIGLLPSDKTCFLVFYTSTLFACKTYIPPTFSERMFLFTCEINVLNCQKHRVYFFHLPLYSVSLFFFSYWFLCSVWSLSRGLSSYIRHSACDITTVKHFQK